MANKEHLDRLKAATDSGNITIWNQWRKEQLDIQPDLSEADLREANLSGANLSEADLTGANLQRSNLTDANLTDAILTGTILLETNLENATLLGCCIYGISAWGLELKGAKQSDLIITNWNEPIITVDNLEVAQFIYLLLHSEKVRKVIDTITSKVVLILGPFTEERKTVLNAVRDELRHRNLLPLIFDFEAPYSRDLTETVQTLEYIARFVCTPP